jgi:hypothetical protein
LVNARTKTLWVELLSHSLRACRPEMFMICSLVRTDPTPPFPLRGGCRYPDSDMIL